TNSISPSATSKLTSTSALWPPGYCLLTFSNRRTLMPAIMSDSGRPCPRRGRPGRRSAAGDQRAQPAAQAGQERSAAPRVRLRRRRGLAPARRGAGLGVVVAVAGGLCGGVHRLATAGAAALARQPRRRLAAAGGRGLGRLRRRGGPGLLLPGRVLGGTFLRPAARPAVAATLATGPLA